MPKKAKLDRNTLKELEMYFGDVRGPMFRLGIALSRHFKETDEIRARFIALEKLFAGYASDVKPQLAEIVRKRK
ncbi:MAG TPA: hypothetical protein VN873_16150 [Candidatus Angelobacter sp.]|nr:hypothetical protein [Candidatus Angelobacter sp.]